jgi:transposase-like protein
MPKSRRSFSAEEKLAIIHEADQFGATQTLRKYNLSHSVFRRWKDSFNHGGILHLEWAAVPRSSYYYKRGDGLCGRKPSKMTVNKNRELVDNSIVLQETESILQQEFCCYGYKNIGTHSKTWGIGLITKKSIA